MKSRIFEGLVLPALFFAALPGRAGEPHGGGQDLPPGVVSVDTFSSEALQQRIQDGYRAEILWDDAFGEFVDVNAYIPNLTADEVYDFIQDMGNLKYWTMAEYDSQPMGTLNGRNRYVAWEPLPPFGLIYLTEEKHPDIRAVDWWVGSDPNDIWMRYCVRVLDAQEFMGKPGAIISWVNFGHHKYTLNPDLYQGFRGMRIAHAIERDNMIKILTWRAAGNTGPLTAEVMRAIGLVNLHTRSVMEIWGMIMGAIAETVAWENLYGGFIGSHFFAPGVPVDQAWGYLSNLDNMNDWTVSIRHLQPFRDGFVALEMLSPAGLLAADTEVHQASRTLDIRMANARFIRHFHGDKWMTSSLRLLDGMETVGKPGTVVVWTTFHHADYDALPELAEEWKYLPVRNQFAANNMRILLSQP